MTDEESPKYKDGDIVWVKLGSCWWPGEVTEEAPEDFTSKKPPLAIVKFFNESKYEFVKTYGNIYLYNCERKNEFIKKGMNSFRSNNPHMEKFPADVTLAEVRTDGNPNILSDNMFAPQKRSNIFAEFFGPRSPKKTPKDRTKQSRSLTKSSSKRKVNITHRRFLGFNDYESHVRLQYPGKDGENQSDGEEIVRLNMEPSRTFECSSCTFQTNRIEVMFFHVQCHAKGITSPHQVRKKTPVKKKKTRVRHITSDDDQVNSSGTLIDTDSDSEPPKPKKKKIVVKKPKEKVVQKEDPDTDIRNNLLAEWSDSDDDVDTSKMDTSGENIEGKAAEEKETIEPENKVEDTSTQPKDITKSCFDFEEEEEDTIVHTAIGRKIPRVIPPNERRKSELEKEESSLVDDDNRVEIVKLTESLNDNSNSAQNDADIAKDELAFKELIDSTAVPDLPEVPDIFGQLKRVSDKKESEVATKLTNPKKRFVKSFEDFELLQNEQRRAQEEREEELRRERANIIESTKPVVVQQSEPVVVPTEETVEEPKTSAIEEVSKEKIEPEDETVPKVLESNSSDVVEEVHNDSLTKLDGDVQISKLKCKIMSKLSDEEIESPKMGKSAHRTPRSKILESYRMNEQKARQVTEEKDPNEVEENRDETKKEKHSPKKSKYLQFSQEETDSVDKVEEEPSKEETKIDVIKEVEAIPDKINSDEEIGKINQIDEYFNDLLFNFDKKPEETKEPSEEKGSNEVHIKCASGDDDEGEVDIAIKTNLTNFNKDDKEMSALSTLAMVSQLENVEKLAQEDDKKEEPPKTTPELVPIDGNLTVVSEKDLADGQVEITANASPIYKKPVTLSSFSMDFSDYNSNSNSDSVSSEDPKPKEEEKKKIPGPDELCDLEEHIPSQIVDKSKRINEPNSQSSSKLHERLTTADSTKASKVPPTKDSPRTGKRLVIKSGTNKVSKPIIISEKIIKPGKPAAEKTGSVSVQKITSKRNLHDPDEIDTFIIQKGAKTVEEDEELELSVGQEGETPPKKTKQDTKKLQVSSSVSSTKKRGKAKILQQTIITPAGEIIPQSSSAADDNVFDINSMPIVLSDQILTPESIENMPIFLSESEPVSTTTKVQAAMVKKPVVAQRLLNKSISSPATPKLVKTPKILGGLGTKIIKQNSFTSSSGKHGKYVIVTQSSPVSQTSKYTVGKKHTIIKRDMPMSPAGTLTKVQNIAPEPSGNKIMIVTNQQGQQQRVLLTPAQQKMMGYQSPGAKLTKTLVKGSIVHKTKDGQMTAIPGSSGLITKTMTPSRLNAGQTLISTSGHVLTPIHTQGKTVRIEKPVPGRKLQMQSQKVPLKPQQKTILIKNQQGQTVRKIQGTDDALLEQQVAEQIEAIKASGVLQQKQEILNYKSASKSSFRRSYAKKPLESPKPIQKKVETTAIPPLTPISPKKIEVVPEKPAEPKQERPLNQLVIQDAMGNQTTITEGQILALPSETVDGQPQSYMLVTLDESGNLTPLNNEALLSLDPNLGLGGDLGNTVLQIDQGAVKEETVVTEPTSEPPKPEPAVELPPEPLKPEPEEKAPEVIQEQVETSVMQTVNEPGQQLIVTGDPIAAQKFLESLTEGSTDLANILASAEGSSILIHADGQQILINTDSDNQMLLSVNTDNLNMGESSEGGGNPIFATQPKNQDILAAALADTDVFQQDQSGAQNKVLQSQLSPNSTLYPMNVGNVLETSLTLNSPIMTPLEVPSTNVKKITDESDILNQVPKNVDLPITITDPNISQTVSQQQVASLLASELQSNLELSIPISDTPMTVSSSEMNSPSFVYSLPSLDGAVDLNHKPFNSSMPLLTEDAEEVSNDAKVEKEETIKTDEDKPEEEDKNEEKVPSADGSFLDENEGLCTLGGEMCSSLSEPPPDMFDLSAVLSSHQMKADPPSPKSGEKGRAELDEAELKVDDKGGDESVSNESGNPPSSPNTANEDSCEIPVQPEIVTTLKDDGFDTIITKRPSLEELENESKKCKFD